MKLEIGNKVFCLYHDKPRHMEVVFVGISKEDNSYFKGKFLDGPEKDKVKSFRPDRIQGTAMVSGTIT